MKIVIAIVAAALLSACATRTIERQTIVEKQPPRVEYLPGPQGPPGPPGPQGDTAVIIPGY
jgi:hypothetical protein